MTTDNVELKDGMKIRKLTELKTEAGKDNEEAMLERVEYFKEKNQEKSARHEHANLYRIMDLLYKHFEMCSYREKELLGKWVNEYGNARGLQDLDENIVKEWKEKFKDSGLTLPSELKGF